jgi:hypothetical protein
LAWAPGCGVHDLAGIASIGFLELGMGASSDMGGLFGSDMAGGFGAADKAQGSCGVRSVLNGK